MFYMWNHKVCIFGLLSSSIKDLSIYTVLSIVYSFIYLGSIVLYGYNILQFVNVLIYWWTFKLLSVFGCYNKAVMNICEQFF
jgi:hypothetical protein